VRNHLLILSLYVEMWINFDFWKEFIVNIEFSKILEKNSA